LPICHSELVSESIDIIEIRDSELTLKRVQDDVIRNDIILPFLIWLLLILFSYLYGNLTLQR